MHIFYLENIDTDNVTLSTEESKHATRVMRLKQGDKVNIVDGKGGKYIAEISEANPKKTQLKIKEKQQERKNDFYLHIAISPTKSIDRFEWFLEKVTEIGIDEITPILTDNSERKVIKSERLNKVLIAAMKQSQRAYLPKLNELVKFKNFIKNADAEQKLIAHCYSSQKKHLINFDLQQKNSLILIGAEGDFSMNEVEIAKKGGFKEISLGNARLRTETAGIVACHIVNLSNL